MASHVECRPLGVFECELCTLTAPYSYVGQKPPNTQSMPPGGKLCHEGSLHLRQGQIPGPRLVLQFVQQAGVCGPGGCSWRDLQEKGLSFHEHLLCARSCAWDLFYC
eukprot:XP_011528266.1 cysteine-rich DPF motif domain-containing protein 1 isoform X3 [Homo sapiens]